MSYDVVIIGGGPAGLSAALALGRARKRVLLCDSGPRRNAAAVHMHNFVTRETKLPELYSSVSGVWMPASSLAQPA
jgi:thioredoxin reductase